MKFRVWDSIYNHWCNPKSTAVDGNGKLYDLYYDVCTDLEINESGAEQFIISKYTGLKDKNGKEIYEGDIIHTKYYNRIYIINFHCDANVFGDKRQCVECEADAEVIGNIYENPELLECKNV